MEKFSRSISKPEGMRGSMNASKRLMTHPANGPMAMAPMSMG